MDEQTKFLAYEAIDENVKDTTAREVIKYVLECEVYGSMYVLKMSNTYLKNTIFVDEQTKAPRWNDMTLRKAIQLAKKSQFITTTGRDRTRTFELNMQFLKGKMAEIVAREAVGKIDANVLSDLIDSSGIRDL